MDIDPGEVIRLRTALREITGLVEAWKERPGKTKRQERWRWVKLGWVAEQGLMVDGQGESEAAPEEPEELSPVTLDNLVDVLNEENERMLWRLQSELGGAVLDGD